jgi:hypothetical protein
MAHQTNMIRVEADTPEEWQRIKERARHVLRHGNLLGISVDGQAPPAGAEAFLHELRAEFQAPVVPVYCGPLDPLEATPRVRVVFGPPLEPEAGAEQARAAIRNLGGWIRDNDHAALAAAH